MLEDYREELTGTPSDEQIREMWNILTVTVVAALRILPDIPENQAVRRLLDTGAVAALYQKVSHKLTREEFDREVEELLELSRKEFPVAPREGDRLS